MKKNEQDISLPDSELGEKQNLYSESYKTTNVNILLNRVRLDKKKSFRKKIIIFFTLVLIIAAITAYFIL